MNIKRWVADFGNSVCQQMIDGHYFEMPSSISEIGEKDAMGMFANAVTEKDLPQQLVLRISTPEGYRYYKVGERAKADLLGNAHIHGLHDKTQSQTVWLTWLAGMALYHAIKAPASTQADITVDYFGTLLPVWLVKKADRFGEKLDAMAARFRTDVTYELLTAGYERTIALKVKRSACRVEGETARFAIKYDLEVNEREEAERYRHAYVVMDDIGGQSQDLCRLSLGLGPAQTADDFASATDQSYLTVLEKLRSDKLMHIFADVRSLESFIVASVANREFIYRDPVTHKDEDLGKIIEPVLHDFAEVAMQKSLQSFHFRHGQAVYYIHMGGVNQVLRYYMEAYLQSVLGDVAKTYHIFPDDSRRLNINACEIVAKSELKRLEDAAHG